MDAVFLNSAGDGVDAGVEHGEQGNMVFGSDEAVGFVEGFDVVGAVIGRQSDAGEDDFAAGLQQSGDDGVEVAAGVGDGDAAESVVAAELDDDNGGMEAEDVFEAVDAVFGSVAADTGVDNFVAVAAAIEGVLQVVGPGEAGGDAVTGGDAVAEAGNDGSGASGDGNRAGRDSVQMKRERKRGGEGRETAKQAMRFVCHDGFWKSTEEKRRSFDFV